MKKFKNIATVVNSNRVALDISQEIFARIIGYKNGQFVSNVERGLCSIPTKKLVITAEALKIDPEVLIEAILLDEQAECRRVVFEMSKTIQNEPDLFQNARTPSGLQ